MILLPKYSVLMTVYYNDEISYISEAIDSMLNQSHKPSEFVIVQDGPVPEMVSALINEYKAKEPDLFRIFVNDNNEGLGAALRRGVELCRFDYIARMDADDISAPNRCEKILSYMINNPDYSLVGSDCIEFTGNINNIKGYVRLPQDPTEVSKFAKKRVPIRHPSIVFKKKDVIAVGNYNPLRRSQEYDLVVRMIMADMKISNVQEILFYIRVNDDFYSRRGGWDKAKLLASQRKDFYKYGYYSFLEYCLYACINIVMCMVPNSVRAFLYQKLLRRDVIKK